MLKQWTASLVLVSGALLGTAGVASAQQTVNLTLGYDTVVGQDSRTGAGCPLCEDQDILIADRRFLSFDVSDFKGFTIGGEWLIPIGQFIEAGAGVSYRRQTVPSVYTNYVNASGGEVEQKLQLRLVPVDFTVRVLPLRQTSPIQPYGGIGLELINWRYQETGDYIDFSGGGRTIYCVGPDTGCDPTYDSSGTEKTVVYLGGLRFAGRTFAAGGEVRFRPRLFGTLDTDFTQPPPGLANRFDLGGWTFQGTFGYRFGH